MAECQLMVAEVGVDLAEREMKMNPVVLGKRRHVPRQRLDQGKVRVVGGKAPGFG